MISVSTRQLLEELSETIGAIGRVDQLGFVVENLDDAVAEWGIIYGEDVWRYYTFDATLFANSSYRGEPGSFKMRQAFASSSPQIELIEAQAGPSIYHEWIEKHGYGLHHVMFVVDSAEATIESFAAAGLPVVQSGSGYGLDGDGHFAYFDLGDRFPLFIEIAERPARAPSDDPLS